MAYASPRIVRSTYPVGRVFAKHPRRGLTRRLSDPCQSALIKDLFAKVCTDWRIVFTAVNNLALPKAYSVALKQERNKHFCCLHVPGIFIPKLDQALGLVRAGGGVEKG